MQSSRGFMTPISWKLVGKVKEHRAKLMVRILCYINLHILYGYLDQIRAIGLDITTYDKRGRFHQGGPIAVFNQTYVRDGRV
jgi:hypothetical protein